MLLINLLLLINLYIQASWEITPQTFVDNKGFRGQARYSIMCSIN